MSNLWQWCQRMTMRQDNKEEARWLVSGNDIKEWRLVNDNEWTHILIERMKNKADKNEKKS